MNDSKFQIMPTAPDEKMDTPERIVRWLKDLDITGADKEDGEIDNDLEAHEQQNLPTTPSRKACVYEARDDRSPTADTSFSGTSVFDSPLQKHPRPAHQSPFSSPIHDDTSDNTSIDAETWTVAQKNEHGIRNDISPSNAAHKNEQQATVTASIKPSIATTEPGSDNEPIPFRQSPPITPQDPNSPRTVWIASCLQCTLSHLPCSRSSPSCSRCKRKGNAQVCLLQRRWFAEEIIQANGVGCTVPILLKMKGEDEGVWKRKVEVARELFEMWFAEQDRRNWVLPSVESPRGGFPVVGRGGRVSHPGEGLGQVVHAELVVDIET
nr:hypothetical protein [Phoma sp.]